MADAAQTQYDPGRFGVALFDGQALRLERSGLSSWRLVFQSIRMAISVHVRGLVCAWWIGTSDAIHSIAYRLGALRRPSSIRYPIQRIASPLPVHQTQTKPEPKSTPLKSHHLTNY